jgi:tetratricopeptide (TPR) repeat protein
VDHLERAGARAFARSANTEAAACFEQALAALAHLPATRASQERAIDLRFSLRNALTPLGPAHRVLEHLHEAERLAGQLGDEHRRARALSFAANALCLTADYEQAIDAAEQARGHAIALGDVPLIVAAGMYLGRARAGLGRYRAAADVLQEVAASLAGDRARESLGLPVLPAVFARSHLVLALAELGEFDAAERIAAEALDIADAVRHPDTLLWAHAAAGMARLVRGRLEEATAALERALELCRTADMPVYVPLVGAPLGLAYAMAGRAAEGLALATQAVEQTEARRQVALRTWSLLRLGEVRLLAGDSAGAAEAGAAALGLFEEHREQGGQAYALRLLGAADQEAGDAPRAADRLRRAWQLAVELGMRPLAARCQLGLAMLQSTGAMSGDADTPDLAECVGALAAMGMEHWARPGSSTQSG